MDNLLSLWASSGLAQIQAGQLVMMLVGLGLLYLAISKGFEPLLLVPIGFGTILANVPGAGFDAAPVYDAMGHMESPGGLLYYIYHAGIETGLFPLLIFMGVGAMTDFGPLLANPKTLLLGAAAQVGIFTTVVGAVALSHFGIFDFTIQEAASIGIIGGADGPTAIFVTSKLAPDSAWAHCCSGLLLYGPGTHYPAADYARPNDASGTPDHHGAAAPSDQS